MMYSKFRGAMRRETEEVLEQLLDMYQSGDDIETKKRVILTQT